MGKNKSIKNKALKVLILEDSLLDMESIFIQLTEAGYQPDVTHVENEDHYIKALEKNRYDLILSDFKLPGFDAFGALEISQKFCPEVPFICVSGYIGEETAIDLLKKGAVDYVLKDRPQRLPFAIKNALAEAKEMAARILTRQKLKESENRFRQVAETAREWIWEVDTNGLYTYSSPVIETLLGYTTDEVVGKKYFYDFFIPDKKEEMKQGALEFFAKKEVFRNFENTNVHRNGSLVIFSTSGCPLIDDSGNLTGYRGADEDITERKQAEEKLILLNRAVEASSVSVVITDAAGIINYVNPYFTKLTGYSDEELLGKNPRFLNSGYHPKSFYEELWNEILSGKDWVGEFRNKKKNGELFWESAIISPIIKSNGVVTNFVAIKEDVTERKKNIDELSSAKKKAEESDRLKTAFLHNISHEIRTPMNAIIGFSSLLSEPELDAESKTFYTDTITQSSNQLLAIINDIVDISNIEAGIINLSNEEVSINKSLMRLENQFSLKAKERGIILRKVTPFADDDKIITDSTKFMQVFSNLLSNAFKFTTEGTIEFGYRPDKEYIEFYVSDTGIGLPLDQLTKIFDRFYQVDFKMDRLNEGTGLGLSISKGFVDLMGGKIWVESEPGKGSKFIFTLPLTRSEEKEEAVSTAMQNYSFEREYNILVAEDDMHNSHLINSFLNIPGLKVKIVDNGAEAVEHCKSGKPVDLVLMDLKMPVMDGFEATKLIKEYFPHLPVIVQTAYASEADIERALSSGCNDFITKPFRKETLISKIRDNLL